MLIHVKRNASTHIPRPLTHQTTFGKLTQIPYDPMITVMSEMNARTPKPLVDCWVLVIGSRSHGRLVGVL